LRGKPIAVAAYVSPRGCILAPSIEAKRFGVKTGMRVMDGKVLCPNLLVLPSDPWKYRNVHLSLRQLIKEFTDDFNPKSIDEFVLNLTGYPCILSKDIKEVGREIKMRIKKEIGDWLTVSVGISTNRYLAKLASGLQKPDGLTEINKENYWEVYSKLNLTDLPYIKERNAVRLWSIGVNNVVDFYKADIRILKLAFHSILGYYWHLRLRGWEIDNVNFARRSYGNSFALPKGLVKESELAPILTKLVTKMSFRLRQAGFKAKGVHLAIWYRDAGFWHKGVTTHRVLFETREIYKEILRILRECPYHKPVRELAVSAFNLVKSKSLQLELFENTIKKENLTLGIDKINERWGNFVITSGRMVNTEKAVPDRIAFGGVKELEEFTLQY
jgi:DNA polymerase-4